MDAQESSIEAASRPALAPDHTPCRGFRCDNPQRCFKAQHCTYKSSAEEAREMLMTPPEKRHVGCLGCSTCEVPPKYPGADGLASAHAFAQSALPTDAQARKDVPLCDGVLDYFTAALAEVARVSKAGNDQHNPGQPLHWARGKSTDHHNCIIRHLADRGSFDTDGQRHTAKLAWRALALLQEELEAAGAPRSRASR